MGQSCDRNQAQGHGFFLRIDHPPKMAAVLQQPQITLPKCLRGYVRNSDFFVRPGWLWNEQSNTVDRLGSENAITFSEKFKLETKEIFCNMRYREGKLLFSLDDIAADSSAVDAQNVFEEFPIDSLVDWGSEWISAKQKQKGL